MTADLRAALEREIAAIRECRHCGGESEYDRGRITALDWVARTFAALASTPEPAPVAQPLAFDKSSGKEPAPVAEGLDVERLARALVEMMWGSLSADEREDYGMPLADFPIDVGDLTEGSTATMNVLARALAARFAAASPSPETE